MYAMNVMNTLSCHFLVQRFYYNLVFIHVTFTRLLNLFGYGSSVPVENDVTDHVVLLVNNLGGLSQLELGGVVAEVRRALDKPGIQIMRLLSVFFYGLFGSWSVFAWIDGDPPSARQISICPDLQSPCFCSLPQTTRELPPLISFYLYWMTLDGSSPLGLSQSHYPPFRPFLP
jgi:hypothetical protein